MIVYAVTPIDFWTGWQRPADLFRARVYEGSGESHDPAEWAALWAEAKALAARIGWAGDIREGPFVTVLPERPGAGGTAPVVIAWKQDRGGLTFVASPFPLPWIEEAHEGRAEG